MPAVATVFYVLTKFLYLVNAIVQLYLTTYFLGFPDMRWGLRVSAEGFRRWLLTFSAPILADNAGVSDEEDVPSPNWWSTSAQSWWNVTFPVFPA